MNMGQMRLMPWCALVLTLLATTSAVASTDHARDELISTPDSYASPGTLIELGDGRRLNLRCSGSGEPVVILEAGANADSSSWFRVQPRIAKTSRVCSYDRAGYGFSDEGSYPRGIDAAVSDLKSLVEAAEIRLPVVLVGHSLGSNIVRKYAQMHPKHVLGMVLVDPPHQGGEELMPEEWKAQSESLRSARTKLLNQCERAAEKGDRLHIQQNCLRGQPDWVSDSVAAATIQNKSKPFYWRTLGSELEQNIGIFSEPVPEGESYGNMPLVLLRLAEPGDGAPERVGEVIELTRQQTHARILAGSRHASLVEVENSSHDIQLDRPEMVVEAIEGLLDPSAQSQ